MGGSATCGSLGSNDELGDGSTTPPDPDPPLDDEDPPPELDPPPPVEPPLPPDPDDFVGVGEGLDGFLDGDLVFLGSGVNVTLVWSIPSSVSSLATVPSTVTLRVTETGSVMLEGIDT